MSEKDSVQDGRVVSMDYTLWVDGQVVDSSEGSEPLEFLAGRGNIISGLESRMMGMKIGESQDVDVRAADAYGEYDEEAIMDVARKEFPKDMPVEPGTELSVRDDSGQSRYARIETVGPETVRLNFNHPLAGKDLRFNVKIVGLREPTAEELDHGHVHQAGHHH
ncbi:MAG: FKBP-type peptidyl-prolyl cis-trans isomerase [Bacteroidota bacterium]